MIKLTPQNYQSEKPTPIWPPSFKLKHIKFFPNSSTHELFSSVITLMKDTQKNLITLANEYRNSNNAHETKWVVNISSRSLTKTEVEVLQKGSKFAPAPSNIPYNLSPTSKPVSKT